MDRVAAHWFPRGNTGEQRGVSTVQPLFVCLLARDFTFIPDCKVGKEGGKEEGRKKVRKKISNRKEQGKVKRSISLSLSLHIFWFCFLKKVKR
jgi:hypothetical protein